MSLRLGLTGSIGMGKSTTAGFFRDFGVPVWDADAEVHALYAKGGGAVAPIGALLPDAIAQGFVDRAVLKSAIADSPDVLDKIGDIIRPMLKTSRLAFEARHLDAPVALYDVPLLFETDLEAWMNHVLVVTAPENIQRQRVLARGNMSEEVFKTIFARQMSDVEKRALADTIFDTSLGMDHTKAEVKALIKALEQENA